MNGVSLWLEALVQRMPNSAALTGTLLHSLWEGAAIALALSVVLVFVRSSRLRYAASCVAMVALVVGLVVTFTQLVPARPVGVRLSALVRTASADGVVRVNWVAAPKDAAHAMDPMVWIGPLWMAGVFFFYLRAVVGWVSAVKIRKTGVCSAPEVWRARVEQLGARLRMTRLVALLESSIAEVPVVVGYLRPVILMPVGLLAGLPVSQVEAILLHELAHIRRFDSLVNLGQVFVEGLLFYHPAVWWISSVIRAERENCCDEVVVSMTGAPHELAKALTALEQRRIFPREALAVTGSRLVNRIARLLGRPQRRYAGAVPLMAMLVLTIATISATAGLQPEMRMAMPPAAIAKAAVVPARVKPAPVLIAQAPATPTQQKAPPPKPQSALPAPAADSPVLPQYLYKVGPGDMLSVMVVDQPQLSRPAIRVADDGSISVPSLSDRLTISGLSLREVETEIVHQLIEQKILSQALVQVQLLRQAIGTIKVIGDVRTPGQYEIESPMSLYDALATAGWTTVDAGSYVLVTKPGADNPQQISLDDLQKNDKGASINLVLNGGEVINVPDAPKVWVTGNVTHPIGVLINKTEDATVLKVLARVEGLTQYSRMAYIYRAADNGVRHEITIPLKDIMHRKAPDVPLQTGDVLLIPDESDALRRLFLQQLQEENPQYRLQPPQYYDTKPVPLWLLEQPK